MLALNGMGMDWRLGLLGDLLTFRVSRVVVCLYRRLSNNRTLPGRTVLLRLSTWVWIAGLLFSVCTELCLSVLVNVLACVVDSASFPLFDRECNWDVRAMMLLAVVGPVLVAQVWKGLGMC